MRRFAHLQVVHLSIGYAMLHCPRNFMRTVITFSAFSAISIAPALAADPTGDWRVAEGVANVRIAECNGSMWGVIAWEQEPGGRDKNNPEVSKKSRPTLGMPILIDMKKKPSVDQWEGEVYNAKDGKTYSSASCVAGKPGRALQVRFPQALPTVWQKARRRHPRKLRARRTPIRQLLPRQRKCRLKSKRQPQPPIRLEISA
jgi:uncharacterized protein (DUF2147 family)